MNYFGKPDLRQTNTVKRESAKENYESTHL